MKAVLAIDIGSTHCKAVVCKEDFSVLHAAQTNCPISVGPNGESEQNPETVFQVVLELIQQSFQKTNNCIQAISFSAAMHSLLAIDENKNVLMPALTWADTRSAYYAKQLAESSEADELYYETGVPIHPMSPLCKIIWMRHEQPELFQKVFKFLSLKEYIIARLLDTFIIDYSLASATGLFHIMKLQWHEKAMKIAGITQKQLSTPVNINAIIPASTTLLSRYSFLPKQLCFIIGASDGCLAHIGCGAIHTHETTLTIGTSAAVRMNVTQPANDKQKRLFNYVSYNNLFLSGGALNNGGNVLSWLNQFFKIPNHTHVSILLEQAASVLPGANGLVALPYIYGERAPVWNAEAAGIIVGLRSFHTQEHFIRAFLEGICFALCDIVKALEEINGNIEIIYATGGFTQSAFWVQMLSDVLNKPLKINNTADASAMGAAILAMHSLAWIAELPDTTGFNNVTKIVQPQTENSIVYERLFTIYHSLYSNIAYSFPLLKNIAH